jgi:hypothetical protein
MLGVRCDSGVLQPCIPLSLQLPGGGDTHKYLTCADKARGVSGRCEGMCPCTMFCPLSLPPLLLVVPASGDWLCPCAPE